ncbi:hypothetical protein FNV43_RR08895 [Rhamnella rubrinervis]|uniref:Uncharacterized protein n=1 Tax=Rhamnella rubrinervis TaxID=2594499 RepID=A0A8K0HA87_9ROSA|nr:hypothetical protein FNV43_RR08895 [Rhamnella rubrinervis]
MLGFLVDLENLGIIQFSRLIEAGRRTSLFVKVLTMTGKVEKKPTHRSATFDNNQASSTGSNQKEKERYPTMPYSEAELHVILGQWIGDGVTWLPSPHKPPITMPCSEVGLHVILDQWMGNGVTRLPSPHKPPTKEEKSSSSLFFSWRLSEERSYTTHVLSGATQGMLVKGGIRMYPTIPHSKEELYEIINKWHDEGVIRPIMLEESNY